MCGQHDPKQLAECPMAGHLATAKPWCSILHVRGGPADLRPDVGETHGPKRAAGLLPSRLSRHRPGRQLYLATYEWPDTARRHSTDGRGPESAVVGCPSALRESASRTRG